MGVRSIVQTAALLTIVLVSGCATYSTPEKSVPLVPPLREVSLSAIPEEGYTWQHLMNLVVLANPDYATILAEARAEYFRYKSRTDIKDIQLSLGYSYISDERRRDQYDIGIRFYIPNPFVNKQIIRTGEAARRETETGIEALKNEIAAMIYELVHEILIGERELSVLLLREQVLSDWAEYLKMRYDARIATQADMSAFDIQRLRLKTAIQQARLTVHAARRSLQVLVQIPDEQLVLKAPPSDWEVVLGLLEDEQQLMEGAFSRSAELAEAYAAYEKVRSILNTARARQIPWFDSVQLSYAPSFTESINYGLSGELISSWKKSNEWIVGLNLNLPVFAWFSSEKKMAAAEIDAASLRVTGIRQRIYNDMTVIIADLRDTLQLLKDYQSVFDSIPEPTRETISDLESYYKLLDARLSASEYALKTEIQCAHIYSQLLKIAGEWE